MFSAMQMLRAYRWSYRLYNGLLSFCTGNIIPTKTLSLSNNKPWVTKDIKAALNKAASRRGDKEEMKKVQTELNEKLAESKECYRRNLENKLQQNNTREV